ncbi:MAG TPA: DUF4190 domain-containing protein, partial [Jatrophihabitantaceae bacterium]|nr:DUF4190 domain-containing protein [Jatrophihabitantaceae bacterium]
PYGQVRPGNGRAIAGLVLGVLSIAFCWTTLFDVVFVVPAIILSIFALGAARRGASGRGQAKAGLITGIVGAVCAIVLTIVFVVVIRGTDCGQTYRPGSFKYRYCAAYDNSND